MPAASAQWNSRPALSSAWYLTRSRRAGARVCIIHWPPLRTRTSNQRRSLCSAFDLPALHYRCVAMRAGSLSAISEAIQKRTRSRRGRTKAERETETETETETEQDAATERNGNGTGHGNGNGVLTKLVSNFASGSFHCRSALTHAFEPYVR